MSPTLSRFSHAREKRLSAIFRTVVAAIVLAGNLAPQSASAEAEEERPQSQRYLTVEETALVKSVFGDEIDTTNVFMSFFNYYATDRMADAAGNEIRYFGKSYFSSNYAKAHPELFGTFVHEMTHILQAQKEEEWDCTQYKYPLALKYKFADYCDEQQAAIVEDYARRFLHPSHAASLWYGKDTPASDALLQKVVEDRFPQARETRLSKETASGKRTTVPTPQPSR